MKYLLATVSLLSCVAHAQDAGQQCNTYAASIDRAQNASELKQLVKVCGWPRKSVHGITAVNKAFFIMHTSDPDSEFFKEAVVAFKDLATKQEVSAQQYAYLFDLSAIKRTGHQRYGTQLEATSDCRMRPKPVENPVQLDELRKSVGLEPIEDLVRTHETPKWRAECAKAK